MDIDLCVICFEKIQFEQMAFVKDCEHAYCVTCILQWANYKKRPFCPQCKHPFETLYVHRSLDGCMHDFMFEESVCLLLRAQWFITHLTGLNLDDTTDEIYQYFELLARQYDENDDDDYINYFQSNRSLGEASSSSSRPVGELASRPGKVGAKGDVKKKKKDEEKNNGSVTPSNASKYIIAKRENRAIKKEAANRAAAEKHQRHLKRLGRSKAATN